MNQQALVDTRAPEPIHLTDEQADWLLKRVADMINQTCQPILDRAQADVDKLQAANAELKGLNAAQAERIEELRRQLKSPSILSTGKPS